MDFLAAALLICLYFIRPQDWVPGLAGFNVMRIVVALGVFGLFTRERPDEDESPRPFVKITPHDVIMVLYAVYIASTAPDLSDALGSIIPLVSFYFITTLALNSPDRLYRYMRYWIICILVVAAMALATKVGIDITDAADRIVAMEGRLVLNTWMHNNPNALGHTVILAFPLVFFFFFWKRSFTSRFLSVLLFLLAGYCVYLTESKGAYLVGLATILISLIFGRPRFVQILILVVAATTWSSLLSALPRMEQLQDLRSDEGVMGRLMAWELARTAAKNNPTGVGFQQFEAYIEWEGEAIKKATHSSYVRIGADLGYPGLFLYLLALFYTARTLLHYRGGNLDMERVRRCLFSILIAYLLSNWMIDRPYHTEFFLLIAATRSFHRLSSGDARRPDEPDEGPEEPDEDSLPPATPEPVPGQHLSYAERFLDVTDDDTPAPPPPVKLWNRLGLLDIPIGIAMVWLVLKTWDYVLKNL